MMGAMVPFLLCLRELCRSIENFACNLADTKVRFNFSLGHDCACGILVLSSG